jgi:hypothetical protein
MAVAVASMALGKLMKRSLLAALASLTVFLATPGAAAAGQPYAFPETSLSLSYTNGSLLAAIYGPQTLIYVVVSPLRLTVSVIGPPGGSKIGHIAVSIRGIDCTLHCHTEHLYLHVPRLSDSTPNVGFRSVTARTDAWGCGRPSIRAQIIFRSGAKGPVSHWTPDTGCGE